MFSLLAVRIDSTPIGTGGVGSKYPDMGGLLNVLVKNSLTVAGVILLALFVIGGLMYIISAGGDPKKAAAAAGLLTNTAIGFAVVFLAYFIIQIIELITGLKILNSGL